LHAQPSGKGAYPVEITIDPIKEDELSVLKNLFEFAVYDLSELNKANIKKTGLYEPKTGKRTFLVHTQFTIAF
jgi:hypothetical protein